MTMPLLAASAPPLRGVIFDLDGVIVDSHATHRAAWRIFLQALGRNVDDGELDFILDGRKRRDILRHFLGNISEDKMAEYGQNKDRVFQQMQSQVGPIAGVVPLIHQLHEHGMALAVASSASPGRVRSSLIRLGIEECFRAIVTAEDVDAGKPDPAVYALAAQQLREPVEFLLTIEDAVSGIQSATGAGLACLAVASHQSRENLLAAGAFETVADFTQISAEKLQRMHQNYFSAKAGKN
jgi:HAD superfamily hydrolase (TIGR01509 family)